MCAKASVCLSVCPRDACIFQPARGNTQTQNKNPTQAFGARNYAVLGDVLLRARVICWAVCIPLAVLWWHIEPLLLALGQAPAIASLAAANMRILVPSLFLGACFCCVVCVQQRAG